MGIQGMPGCLAFFIGCLPLSSGFESIQRRFDVFLCDNGVISIGAAYMRMQCPTDKTFQIGILKPSIPLRHPLVHECIPQMNSEL